MAKQKVREAEREAQIALTRGQETRRLQVQTASYGDNVLKMEYLDEEAEEEERLLEEMTRGYIMDDFEFGIQSKSALPRQSRSGSLSSKLWEGPTTSSARAVFPKPRSALGFDKFRTWFNINAD
ncbi:hypothetical protein AbraCBS73388_010273, partial [Aspergillus brasiliensis]